MKKIFCIIIFVVFIFCLSFTDSIVYYKLIKIVHPVLDYDNPKPLIVEFEYQWGGRPVYSTTLTITPLNYKITYKWGDSESTIDDKRSNITYYDAYENPIKEGFILFRKTIRYSGEDFFEEIQIWGYNECFVNYLEPTGTDMYYTEDKKYLVTVWIPYFEGASEEELEELDITLWYYDLNTFPSPTVIKPIKEITAKRSDFHKFDLIKLE